MTWLLSIIPKRLLIELAVVAVMGFTIYLEDDWRQEWKIQVQAMQTIAKGQQAENQRKEKAYESQLKAAADQAVADRAELDRVRATTHPGKLRCTAAGGSGVPKVPSGAGDSTAGAGALPKGDDPSFDPTERAIQVADEADDVVEQCRTALAKWPRPLP